MAGFAKDYLNQFRGTDRPSVLRNRVTTRRWLPPTAGSVKINYDGAMFGESDKAGLGVVIRTCDGQVVAALSEQIVKPPTVEILELHVARRAISFSADLVHSECVYEGDSLSVVNALKDSGINHSHGGHLIKDILFKLFSEYFFRSCRSTRQCSSACFSPTSEISYFFSNLVGVCSNRYHMFCIG